MLNYSLLSRKDNTHKHNSCMIFLLTKSQLWLQVIVWEGSSSNRSLQSFVKSSVPSFKPRFYIDIFCYCFFLDLFLSGIKVIISADAACSWLSLLKHLKVEYSVLKAFHELDMHNLYGSNTMKTWKPNVDYTNCTVQIV